MFSKKANYNPPPPGVYRDDVDRDDAASTSSAVLLEDVDAALLDEQLPPYEDTPSEAAPLLPGAGATAPVSALAPVIYTERQIAVPSDLPSSTYNTQAGAVCTDFPMYSTSAEQLAVEIKAQASYPPSYYVKLFGTHQETKRQGNKETKNNVTDFCFLMSINFLLVPREHDERFSTKELEILPDNKRGYRGTRLPSLNPTVSDVESGNALNAWCEKYVSDKSSVKSFTLKREIRNHDQKKLEQLIRGAIAETKYHGHLTITFPTHYDKLIVYSPGLVNQWRSTTWIRWVFYLTFLWIFAWPFLILITSRYEIVKSVWLYADLAPGVDDIRRKPTVMSEVAWFNEWQSTIQRAALARINCNDKPLGEDFRLATVAADRRGEQAPQNEIPRTGNAFADGAIGLLGQGLRVLERRAEARGWGHDC